MLPTYINSFKEYSPNTPLEKINDPFLDDFQVNLYVKRDDLIDPIISGNKFRKLKYSLLNYVNGNYSGIVSFGGPWSNH